MPVDLEALEDSPHLLDLLVQMEDILDSTDVYCFKNWLDGEVVEGPKVRRYWLDMTLRYPYAKMPDPKAALRLLKQGVRVDYTKANEEGEALDEDEGKGKADKADMFWLVRISIPRRLILDTNAGQLEFYDDEVDVEDVQDANDAGLNAESAYTEADQNPGEPAEGEEGITNA